MKKVCSLLLIFALLLTVLAMGVSATTETNTSAEASGDESTAEQKTQYIEMTLESFGLSPNENINDSADAAYKAATITKQFGDIVVTARQGYAASSIPKVFKNEMRVYAKNVLSIDTVDGYQIVSVEFVTQQRKPIGTSMAHADTIVTNATYDCASGDTVVTFLPVDGTKAMQISPGEQFRVISILVTYEEAAATGDDSSDDQQQTDDNGEAVATNYDTFELVPNKVDSGNNPYYQASGFLKTFDTFVIAFGNGISEEDAVAAFGNEIRVYAGNTLTISPTKGYKIVSVVINSQEKKPIGSAMAHLSSVVDNGKWDCGVGETVGTFVPVDGTKAMVIKPGEQFRVTSIVVTCELATEEDYANSEETEPAADETEPAADETAPTEAPTQPGETPAETPNNGAVVWIVIAAAVILIAGGVVVLLIRKKKA